MKSQSTEEGGAVEAAPKSRNHPTRLNFSNPESREAHIQAFLDWLPKILQDAPGIHWERLPSQVMRFLIYTVADSPDAISITLATVSAIDAMKARTLYVACQSLNKILERLRNLYGMTMLTELNQRKIWEQLVKGRMIPRSELDYLKRYDAMATHLRFYSEELTDQQLMIWKPYFLPGLPRGFLEKQAHQKAVLAASVDQRKAQSDIVLPLFPLLVELAQLRKQAAERLIKEFRRQRDRAISGEIELPYQFQHEDHQFSISEHATSLVEVRLIEQEVQISLILWNRTSWVKAHPKQFDLQTRLKAEQQVGSYAPELNAFYLQYQGASSNLLWCGDLIENQLLGRKTRQGFVVRRPGILSPALSDAAWLTWARKVSGTVLFEPESLYRGILFATALATLSLTNGSRASELLQVSASRFETVVVDELHNQELTGRKIGILVQDLLPKGYSHESERQFFLISDIAVRLLKEIAELLQATHDGIIPVVHPNHNNNKAEDLQPEPYFFQWAASADGRLGNLITTDVAQLLRFLFHGLILTTRSGEPIRIVPHLFGMS